MCSLICQKPAHFLSAQMALVSTFFQMFIELGMYNFDARIIWYLTWGRRNGWNNHWCSKPCSGGQTVEI